MVLFQQLASAANLDCRSVIAQTTITQLVVSNRIAKLLGMSTLQLCSLDWLRVCLQVNICREIDGNSYRKFLTLKALIVYKRP